jgi:hypothetical protein
VIPFGADAPSTTWANQRYQTLVTAAELGNPASLTIRGLAFAACGSGTGVRQFDALEVRLGQTNSATLSSSFAANLGAAATVLAQRDSQWVNTGDAWVPIGFEVDYDYVAARGANLVIEITAVGSRALATTGTEGFHSGGRPRLSANGWTGPAPPTGTPGPTSALKMEVLFDKAALSTYGIGCKGSNGNVPTVNLVGTGRPGTSVGVAASGALASARGNLSVGFALWDPPLDLGVIGAPGCRMYFDNSVTLPVVYTAAGTAALQLSVPGNLPPGVRAWFQFFVFDRGANPLGVASSDYGRILTGK